MDKSRFWLGIISALSVISLGITLISATHAHWFPPGGGMP